VVWIWSAPAEADGTVEPVKSLSDTAGNEYHRAVGPSQGADGKPEIWYSITASTPPMLQVTALFTGSFAGKKRISAHLFTKAAAWSFGQADDGTGLSDKPICGPVNLAANELLFAAALVDLEVDEGQGFTLISDQEDGNAVMFKVAGPAGEANALATFTSANVQTWVTQLATFK
jgi:hypothetical protein